MLIIWSGLGFMVLLIGASAFAIGIAITQVLFGNTTTSVGMGMALAGILATAGNYALAVWIARHRAPRVMIDKATGREVTLVRRDTLFFIPVRYWTFLFAFYAICLTAGNLADLFKK